MRWLDDRLEDGGWVDGGWTADDCFVISGYLGWHSGPTIYFETNLIFFCFFVSWTDARPVDLDSCVCC